MQGVLVPAGTPKEIVDLLQHEIAGDRQPAGRQGEAAGTLASSRRATRRREFDAYIKAEIAKWGKVIQAANIKVQ